METLVKNIAAMFRKNSFFYVVGITLVLAFKHFYSAAGANDLVWILEPIAHLVELAAGIHFEHESTAGFVSLSNRIVIAPACAGINFLIICFSTLFFTLVSRMKTSVKKSIWLVISIVSAYLVTLWTNSVRIIISIYLYRAQIYGEWVTPERVHRLAGTLIYVSVLVVTYLAAERMVGRFCGKGFPGAETAMPPKVPYVPHLICPPFAWYLAIAVFVPLLNGSLHRQGARFLEHSIFVLAATLSIFLVWLVVPLLKKKKIDISEETKEKRASQ